ncbi:hypothetical protein FACS1894147_03920 [Spirochaetia bacterium]|nr:hypothetical protein FACS1894147_03920 [Spirochaetia bacterium]
MNKNTTYDDVNDIIFNLRLFGLEDEAKCLSEALTFGSTGGEIFACLSCNIRNILSENLNVPAELKIKLKRIEKKIRMKIFLCGGLLS